MTAFGLVEVYPGDTNPFFEHPALADIWPPQLLALAYEAIEDAFEVPQEYGAIFLITHPHRCDEVWGLTGFLPWPSTAGGLIERAGLRWHGLLAQHRGQGVSVAVIDTMRSMAHAKYPQAVQFVEFMPCTTEHAATALHFKDAGFVPWGSPEQVDWSPHLWQEYVCDIRVPLLRPSHAARSVSIPPKTEPRSSVG